MSQIFTNNLMIMWDDLAIHEMFNIITTSDFPSGKAFTYQTEIMPNGKTRLVQSVNNNNIFSITVARENAKDSLKTLHTYFDKQAISDTKLPLRITNQLNGEVLADYDVAALVSPKFIGDVSDGKGNNITLEWSVANKI